jgi:DNA-binding NarL/FixJ family response regulator
LRIVITHGPERAAASFRRALEHDGGFAIVGEAEAEADVLGLISEVGPDVVLVDGASPDEGGIRLLRLIRAEVPEAMVVMYAMPRDPRQIQAAFGYGACGCLLSTINPKDIPSAIRHAVDRTGYHARGLPVAGQETAVDPVLLTRRETEVVRAAAYGSSNKEIAAELRVSVQTVKSHLTSAYRKLGVSNRTQAARWALGAGSSVQLGEPARRS